MKTVKLVLLYLQVAFYLLMGSMHFIRPEQYIAMMPAWLPFQSALIFLSGFSEIILALMLVPVRTRATAAKLIAVMLVIFFFVIHVPQSIRYFLTGDTNFLASLFRLPVQVIFIAWAWMFAKS